MVPTIRYQLRQAELDVVDYAGVSADRRQPISPVKDARQPIRPCRTSAVMSVDAAKTRSEIPQQMNYKVKWFPFKHE
jgi:hypothetical protein